MPGMKHQVTVEVNMDLDQEATERLVFYLLGCGCLNHRFEDLKREFPTLKRSDQLAMEVKAQARDGC